MRPQRRLPMAPLEAYVSAEPLTAKAAARLIGIKADTVASWRKHGIKWARADRIAVSLGTTVWGIWGEDWEQACAADAAEDAKRFSLWPDEVAELMS